MADKETKNDPKKESDPELDALLDSALKDMVKKPEGATAEAAAAPESGASAAKPDDVPPNMWSEDFIKEAAEQFETNMAAILGSFGGVSEDQVTKEQIAQTFAKMAEAATQVLKPSGESSAAPENPAQNSDDVQAAITNTLQNLTSNSENLQAPFSDQDLANILGNIRAESGADGNQDSNVFVPFIQGMMQSLLSKELLYPSLKELLDKYPAYLEENKGKIPDSEYKRFEQQKELMQKVCLELESEADNDPEDVKRKRFENVLELMQKMQDLGQPPEELGGGVVQPPQVLSQPGFGGLNDTLDEKCSIM